MKRLGGSTFLVVALMVLFSMLSSIGYTRMIPKKSIGRELNLGIDTESLFQYHSVVTSSASFELGSIHDLRLITFSDHQAFVLIMHTVGGRSVANFFGMDFYKANSFFNFLKNAKTQCSDGVIVLSNGYRFNNMLVYENFKMDENAGVCEIK